MRATQSAVTVARELVLSGANLHWGYELSRQTGIPSGTLYPILQRMVTAGWLRDGWADADGYHPRRHYYQITETGAGALEALATKARGAAS